MDPSLTQDEYDALLQISRSRKQERASACVARNAKRMTGLKYAAYTKDGQLALTDKGHQTLFVKRCIDGLRALSHDGLAPVDADVSSFLAKKGHITRSAQHGFEVTSRGRESLLDIDRNSGITAA
jgi:hypothetical protein